MTPSTPYQEIGDEEANPFRSLVIRNTRIKSPSETAVSSRRQSSRQRLDRASRVLGSKDVQDLTQNELSVFQEILTHGIDETKYRIVEEIASGGMGNIYCAYDEDIKRHSVLKVILPNYKDDLEIIKRFIFEARITGDLEHPNIISLHDFGFLPGYGIYFTMTYVHGESLLEIIGKLAAEDPGYSKKYTLYSFLNIFRKVCDAVAYAHSKDIIHRDIKPENIMVGKFGEVVLMDWGLAKKLAPADGTLDDLESQSQTAPELAAPAATSYGEIKGTPVYLAPEQAFGDPAQLDKSTDVFLLGATLYHMFTYSAPFEKGALKDVIKRAENTDYVPPEEYTTRNAHLSTQLCSIIDKAMTADKAERYSSVSELIQDIDDLIHGKMEYQEKIFQPGEVLLKEGHRGADCYIIVDGAVDVFKYIGDERVRLSTLTSGDIVGEMALITSEPRTATVIASETTEVIVLTKEVFSHNLKKLPSWMEKAVSALATRLQDTNKKYMNSVILNRSEIDIEAGT